MVEWPERTGIHRSGRPGVQSRGSRTEWGGEIVVGGKLEEKGGSNQHVTPRGVSKARN